MDTLKLLRIPFSYYLMPIFFFALSQALPINIANTAICFIVLHLFIYPASNGYNSYMDKDESSIGGLENPPLPTRQLFYISILFDFIGLSLSIIVGINFFIMVLAYLLVSRAYSYKSIRLKKYPILGFLTVIIFQGPFTFWLIYSNITLLAFNFTWDIITALGACLFLIGGIYPLTQIYQHKEDKNSGDITISFKLGIIGTFIFCASMFTISNIFFYIYFISRLQQFHFLLLQLFLAPIITYFIFWFLKVLKSKNEANFKNTMRMNFIASTFMNMYFLILFILNLLK